MVSRTLNKMGFPTIGGETINHMVLTNVKKATGVDGARVEYLGHKVNLNFNRSIVSGIGNELIHFRREKCHCSRGDQNWNPCYDC